MCADPSARSASLCQALALVQAIDEGYWSQLLLFQDMRCRLDEQHPVYRLWCLEQVGRTRCTAKPPCGAIPVAASCWL
jgi:hypothetical protein